MMCQDDELQQRSDIGMPQRKKMHHKKLTLENTSLDGGFKHFVFSPLLGEDCHFDTYFSNGLVQPTTRSSWDSQIMGIN